MAAEHSFFLALAAMAAGSYVCRIAGFVLMRFVPVTPRVEAALKAIPLGVMIGIVTPAVAAGKLPETVGLVAVIVAMKLTHKDIIAAISGAAAVAICRQLF